MYPHLDIPHPLQEAIHTAVDCLDTHPHNELDAEAILRILVIFHPAGSPGAAITSAQQRLLLLGCLTFRHILPFWQRSHPQDLRAAHFLQQAVQTILQRITPEPQPIALDRLWEQTNALQPCDVLQTSMEQSAYTLTKAIDHAIDPQSLYRDYTLETHVGVALRLMARAYSDHHAHHDHAPSTLANAFWRFWLIAIVPRAWPTLRPKP